MQSHISNKKIAYISLLTTLALICSYVETIIPLNFGIPGIKIGLANIVSVVAIYLFESYIAIIIVIIRVLISGFLFGNMYGILYSMAGGIISIIIMIFIRKSDLFSIFGVSIAGGVTHNLAQLMVAVLVVNQIRLSFCGPVLIVSGTIMGGIIGILARSVIKVLKHMFDSGKL